MNSHRLGLAAALVLSATACATSTGTAVDEGSVLGTLAAAASSVAEQKDEIGRIPDASVSQQGTALLVAFPGDVLFDTGSSALAPGAFSRLDRLAATLNRHPDTHVIVRGHTDAAGTDAANQELSEQRAAAVRRYLVGKGVASSRVESVGFGESRPIETNETPEGRQQNRRVEIEVQPSPPQPDAKG